MISRIGEIVRYYYEIWTAKDENRQSILDYIQAKLVDIERYESGEILCQVCLL